MPLEQAVGLATDIAILSLLALSAYLVLLVGRISFGQQAYFALGAYASGMASTLAGWALAPSLLLGAAVGAVASGLLAWPTLRLSGLNYAVATLALAEMMRIALMRLHFTREVDGYTVGPQGAEGFRDIRWLFDHQVSQSDYLIWASAVLIAVVLALLVLSRTRLGLAMKMVGHDETLAASQGLPVHRLRLLVTALAGAVAAFAGGLYAHQLTYIEPALFDPMLGIHAVGYSMLGGLATPLGPLLGAAFDLGLLEATRWFEGWRMVLFGTLVAIFLRWRPRKRKHRPWPKLFFTMPTGKTLTAACCRWLRWSNPPPLA